MIGGVWRYFRHTWQPAAYTRGVARYLADTRLAIGARTTAHAVAMAAGVIDVGEAG